MTDCLESSRNLIGTVRLNGAEPQSISAYDYIHKNADQTARFALIAFRLCQRIHYSFNERHEFKFGKYANREYEQNFTLNYQIPSPIRSCTAHL